MMRAVRFCSRPEVTMRMGSWRHGLSGTPASGPALTTPWVGAGDGEDGLRQARPSGVVEVLL